MNRKPNNYRRQGADERRRGINQPNSPISTLDGNQVTKRRRVDLDTDPKGQETRIQVVVRCRGRRDEDPDRSPPGNLFTERQHDRNPLPYRGGGRDEPRVYTFDSVYGPTAPQRTIFEKVAAPIVDQTGTGKTHTIEGKLEDVALIPVGEAGIIPRVLFQLFERLNAAPPPHMYVVKLSMLEIYNEDVFDLLVVQDNPAPMDKLTLNLDAARNLCVRGLTERILLTPEEGIEYLRQGSHLRQKTATRLNSSSSRSHCILTLTVSSTTPSEGGDVHRLGKLNLVDLAGSEDIGRSGAVDQQAKEAGKINQSLLALGKVISRLYKNTQKGPGEPPIYRESKLTRILQDSLGGGTRTCIIATISMASVDMKETLSTLKYANQAKAITNKILTIIPKPPLVLYQEFRAENERLKRELEVLTHPQANGQQTHFQDGINLSVEEYLRLKTAESDLTKELENVESRCQLLLEEKSILAGIIQQRVSEAKEAQRKLAETQAELEGRNAECEATRDQLAASQARLQRASDLNASYAQSEEQLDATARKLLLAAQARDARLASLNLKLEQAHESQARDRQTVIAVMEAACKELTRQKDQLDGFSQSITEHKAALLESLEGTQEQLASHTRGLIAQLQTHVQSSQEGIASIQVETDQNHSKLKELLQKLDLTWEGLVASISGEVDAMVERISHFQKIRETDSQQYQSRLSELRTEFDLWVKQQNLDMAQRMEGQSEALELKLNGINTLHAEADTKLKAHKEELTEWARLADLEFEQQKRNLFSGVQALLSDFAARSHQKLAELSTKHTSHLQLQFQHLDRIANESREALHDARGKLTVNRSHYQEQARQMTLRCDQAINAAIEFDGQRSHAFDETLANLLPTHLSAINQLAAQVKGDGVTELVTLADSQRDASAASLNQLHTHVESLLPNLKRGALQVEHQVDACLDPPRALAQNFQSTVAPNYLSCIRSLADKTQTSLEKFPTVRSQVGSWLPELVVADRPEPETCLPPPHLTQFRRERRTRRMGRLDPGRRGIKSALLTPIPLSSTLTVAWLSGATRTLYL
ncbi:Kinesin- motor protein [Massospora cicadina]|nr:Kinesin- motor protein [Massospora cicadina]